MRVGSQLYFHCNLVEFAIALNGGVAMEEHPAASEVPAQTALSALAHQGQSMALWSCLSQAHRIEGHPRRRGLKFGSTWIQMLYRPPPKAQLRGIDSATGEFRTARAKEYPPEQGDRSGHDQRTP